MCLCVGKERGGVLLQMFFTPCLLVGGNDTVVGSQANRLRRWEPSPLGSPSVHQREAGAQADISGPRD